MLGVFPLNKKFVKVGLLVVALGGVCCGVIQHIKKANSDRGIMKDVYFY